MKDYVLDANAVIRYFQIGTGAGGEKVKHLFQLAERNQARLLISAINLGEVLYVLLRFMDEPFAVRYIRALQTSITVVEATAAEALEAATLKHRYKLGYADSFAAALSLTLKATLVSADPSFERVGKSLKWMRLPKFDAKKS